VVVWRSDQTLFVAVAKFWCLWYIIVRQHCFVQEIERPLVLQLQHVCGVGCCSKPAVGLCQ
jgi:hypothetical protein